MASSIACLFLAPHPLYVGVVSATVIGLPTWHMSWVLRLTKGAQGAKDPFQWFLAIRIQAMAGEYSFTLSIPWKNEQSHKSLVSIEKTKPSIAKCNYPHVSQIPSQYREMNSLLSMEWCSCAFISYHWIFLCRGEEAAISDHLWWQ